VTFASTSFGYLIILEPGEEVVRCLIQFAREQEIDAAVITGVGTVAELELGAGGGVDREHRRTTVSEPLETCSLTGTLTLVDGEPFPHLHGSFARSDHSVVGGHVYLGVVDTGLELAIQVTTDAGATAAASSVHELVNRTSP
jgi:uncharacterized protein